MEIGSSIFLQGSAENLQQLTFESDGENVFGVIMQIFCGHAPTVTKNEEILHTLENTCGYCDVMMGMVQQHSIPSEARLFAAICLKNLVNRFWLDRGLARQGLRVLTIEEKDRVKTFVLRYMTEPDNKVMVQLAVLTARIARIEWPQAWVCLNESLLNSAASATEFSSAFQALYTLRRVIKELSTKKVMSGRLAFEAETRKILPPLIDLWARYAQNLGHALNSEIVLQPHSTENTNQCLQIVTVISKIVHTCLVHGVRNFDDCIQIGPLLGQILEAIKWVHTALGKEQTEPSSSLTLLGKLLKRLSTIVVEVQQAQPLHFRVYLEPYLEFFCNYIFNIQTPCPTVWREFSAKSIVFVSNIVSCQYYRPDQTLLDEAKEHGRIITMKGDVTITNEGLKETEAFVANFFTSSNRVSLLAQCCLKRLLLLDKVDLEEWQADPEAFVVEQEQSTVEQNISTSAQHLILALLDAWGDFLINDIVQHAMDASAQLALATVRTVSTDVLEWDAFYLIVGLGSYALDSTFHFQEWFQCIGHKVLESLILLDHGVYAGPPVLVRRLIWMLGCWAHQVSEEIRCFLWDFLASVLWDKKDMFDASVKFAAISTLNSLVEAWEFDLQPFNKQMPRFLTGLYSLFSNIKEIESRQKVLDLVCLLCARSGSGMKPHVEILVSPVLEVWHLCENQTPLHKKLVEILTIAMQVAGAEQPTLHNIAYCLLRMITDASRPFETYLLEDGLQLWLASMKNSQDYNEDMHNLFPVLGPIFERNLEQLKPALLILEAYLICGKTVFMQHYSSQLSALLEGLVDTVSLKGVVFLARVMETLLKIFEQNGFPTLQPSLKKILKACMQVVRKDPDAEPDLAIVNYLSILARAYISSTSLFLGFLESFDPGVMSGAQILTSLVLLMLEKFDYLGSHGSFTAGAQSYPYRRKAWAIFIVSAISSGQTEILRELDQILHICLDVLTELEEPSDLRRSPKGPATIDFTETAGELEEPNDNTILFLQQQIQADPIFLADLRVLLQSQLQVCSNAMLPSDFETMISTVEPTVLKQLNFAKV